MLLVINCGQLICGVISILLISICNVLRCSTARINRGFGVFGRSAYSSILDGLVQKGPLGCSLFVTARIVAFVLLSLLISVSVVIPASFSVLLTVKAPSISLILLLLVGSNFFSTTSVADPYASSPCLSVPRTIIWCTFNRLPWSGPKRKITL
jgi:hypothetical protein